MNKEEKSIREKKWNSLKNKHGYSGMSGGYYFNTDKGYIVKYNSYETKKFFKKLNSHFKRQKIRSLISKENYDNLNSKFEIDIWNWD